jgi:hypothetical protein
MGQSCWRQGVLILRDGQWHGGDAYVYYTGSYECSAGNWQGKITSQEHTPTGRPMAARVQHIGFLGTYNDAGAKVDAMALLGEQTFDTMQRCACWWQTKFDITRPKLTIRYGQARAVWRFPLLRGLCCKTRLVSISAPDFLDFTGFVG